MSVNRLVALQANSIDPMAFVRGQQSAQQNKLLNLQHDNAQLRNEQLRAAPARLAKEKEEQLETRLFGGVAELMSQTDDVSEKAQLYQMALDQANSFGLDLEGAPEQFTPEVENLLRLQASARGFEFKEPKGGFTLSQDQVRFDAQGREVARGPEKTADPNRERELKIKEEANNIRRDELGFRQSQANKVDLSPTVQKILDASQTKAFESGEQAREMELLAKDIAAVDISGGVASTTSEKFKQVLGSQEEVTDLRRRFRGFRASQAVTNLPPGVASDKDIELALSGFPAENANAETIQSFLRGQAKLARLQEGFNIVKSELISDTGGTAGLLTEWRERLEDEEFQASIFSGIDGIDSVDDTTSGKNSFQSSTGIQFTVE